MATRGHKPVRSCIACRQRALKADLMRLVREPDGLLRLDLTGRAPGRGVYLHRQDSCVEKARKRGAQLGSV